ncbi:MAG: hypothetical protein WBW49_00985 [Candidatus Acidiferrum sp.]
MGNTPIYEIFLGSRDKDALWLEAVEGLGAACDRMNELAAQCPGPYFVFCTSTHKVLASVDTHARRDDEDRGESA